jgi:LacI family transcriptional regulator
MISQQTIARHLNISQRTVSLCLAGSDRVAETTRRRVLEVAERMGYRPNRSALAMRSGKFNAVALIQGVDSTYSALPGELLAGLQQQMLARDLHLVLASVPDEKLVDGTFLPSVLREWSVDGFLINYQYNFPLQLARILDVGRLPSVWLNSKRSQDCVYPDDIQGGRKACEHLLRLGHRSIAYFAHHFFEDHHSVSDRHTGYAQAMQNAGLAPRKLHYRDEQWQDLTGAMGYIRSFLEDPDRPTAIVAYEAFEGMRVALAAFQLGLRIPGDLSIVTFHERPATSGGVPLTTMVIPEREIAGRAMSLLADRIAGEPAGQSPVGIPYGEPQGRASAGRVSEN